MIRVICAACGHKRRPYGIVMRKINGPGYSWRDACPQCGLIITMTLDYILSKAPIDVTEAVMADGTPCELVDEPRSKIRAEEKATAAAAQKENA